MAPRQNRDRIVVLALILAAAAAVAACERKQEPEARKDLPRPRSPLRVVPALGIRG